MYGYKTRYVFWGMQVTPVQTQFVPWCQRARISHNLYHGARGHVYLTICTMVPEGTYISQFVPWCQRARISHNLYHGTRGHVYLTICTMVPEGTYISHAAVATWHSDCTYVSVHSTFTAVVKVITVTGILLTIFILAPTATTVQKLWYCTSNSQYFGTYKAERQTDRQTW